MSPADKFCARCGTDVSGVQSNVATDVIPAPRPPSVTDRALLEELRRVTLGDYEVQAELGKGGMATVFLAHEIALDRKVAIKVMSPALISGEGMAERFKREARTAASLSHPNIIPVYAVRESEHLLYFVMKFIEGRALDSIIKEVGPLPIPMAQALLQQVGSALGYAHKRGIVHRDVKPANVMVDAEGWAVVTDFGIAKVAQAHTLTMTGATVGTPSYMSPEQCAAKELTGASDQYSLGVVAYEMLVGKLPFTAESVMAVMYSHFNDPPPPLGTIRKDVPPELAAAVMRMLEKEPEKRWPTLEAAMVAVGGTPLAHDDPIRGQLVTLAGAGASSQLLKRVSTPASPSPIGRSRAGKTTNIAALAIAPAQVTIAVGGAVQLSATAKRKSGSSHPGYGITWASTNTDVVAVSPTGLATGIGSGTATITAAQENTSATATITVTEALAGRRRPWLAIAAVLLVGIAGGIWWFKPWAAREQGASPEAVAGAPTTVTSPPAGGQAAAPTGAAPAGRDSAAVVPPPPAPAATQPAGKRPSGPAKRGAARTPSPAQVAQASPRESTPVPVKPEPTPPPASVAPAQPPPAVVAPAPAPPPPPVDPRPQIEGVIAAYARALQARDLAAVKRIAPGLGADRLKNLQDFFESVRNLKVSLDIKGLDVNGDAASAQLSGTFAYIEQGGNAVNQPVRFRATLERGADGWHIATLQ